MSLKEKLGQAFKQAGSYLEQANLKEKIVEMKDKTVDKVKGIDNPDHYTAPTGFTLFKIPVALSIPEISSSLDQLARFSLKDQDKIADAYTRVLSLMDKNESIVNAITASMKKTYLIVWTNKDRIFIVHKEHYKLLLREQMYTFKMESTKVMGFNFVLNEYHFTCSEKEKAYRFIRKYCHEYTKEYHFISYLPVTKNLNYYERFKYEKLNRENQAVEENKQLSVLLEPFEFPLASIFTSSSDSKYILMISTNRKIYMLNQKEYTVLTPSDIMKIDCTNKGVFSSEFYMDNYYFTGVGPEEALQKFIQYIKEEDIFLKAKQQFLEENEVLMTFPFKNSISYQTPAGIGIVISEKEDCFLICSGLETRTIYQKGDLDHYELIKDEKASKEDMWSSGVGKKQVETKVSYEEAIQNYEKIWVRIFLKKSEIPLEIPLILMKTVYNRDIEETSGINAQITKQFLDQLEHLKG